MPTPRELDTLKHLPIQKIANITLDQAILIRNDKVMTPERIEVLVEEKFKH